MVLRNKRSDSEQITALIVMLQQTAGQRLSTSVQRTRLMPTTDGCLRRCRIVGKGWRPQRDSNPCLSLERARSWASGRWGRGGVGACGDNVTVESGLRCHQALQYRSYEEPDVGVCLWPRVSKCGPDARNSWRQYRTSNIRPCVRRPFGTNGWF